jgi:hypothetical protein
MVERVEGFDPELQNVPVLFPEKVVFEQRQVCVPNPGVPHIRETSGGVPDGEWGWLIKH